MKRPSGGFIGCMLGLLLGMVPPPWFDHRSAEEFVGALLICVGLGGLIGTVVESISRRRG